MIVKKMQEKFNIRGKQIVQSIRKLEKYPDIFEEFKTVLANDDIKLLNTEITESGHTAKELNLNYSLSILGAYNYLIYLRELPSEALNYLEKGLPIK